MKEYNLEDLKKDYELLMKKYSLPSFKEMNETFDIEVLAEAKSEILLKRIRKVMSEKLASVLRILEALINPPNTSVFLFNIIKGFNEEDKKIINELYKKLNQIEIKIFGLEIEYDEKKEADFIKNFMQSWKGIKGDLRKIEAAMERCSLSKSKKQEKSYFG